MARWRFSPNMTILNRTSRNGSARPVISHATGELKEETVMDTLYYTPKEVAEQLKLRVQTVYEYIRKGRLPAVRLGNRCRIARSDLEAFVARQRDPASASRGHSEPATI